MANQEHVDLLKQGIAEWNLWRDEHPKIRPDLRSAKLNGSDLTNADLTSTDFSFATLSRVKLIHANLSFATFSFAILNEADLSTATLIHTDLSGDILNKVILNEAKLTGAILKGANLSTATLIHTDFNGADLSGVILNEADLTNTDLSGANLNNTTFDGAILTSANLSGADLTNADLTRANLWDTVFANNDLSTTKGLAEVYHKGPSHIELHSVKLPQDGSALHFLRGVGIPDEWIDFYHASMMHPIHYYSCFISYASDNEDIAKRLHADLQASGVRCWFAPHDLKPGDFFREEIDKAIHLQDKLLLIFSEQSVASKWVRYEVNRALDREVNQERMILFPIRLDDAVLHTKGDWAHSLRSSRHIGNFTRWQEHQGYQEAFTQLLQHLKDETT